MPQATELAPFVTAIDIKVPIQKVWAEITKTGGLQPAIYNTRLEMQPRPGSRLRYYSPNKKRVFVVGEVLEIEPPRKFKHTYHFLMNGKEPPTIVTWELAEIPGGTRVTLTHAGFTTAHKGATKQQAGWQEILALLKSELETGGIPFKTRMMYGMMGMMSFMLPKTTRVEEAERMGF
jgi:uncharacterized protein YndB with AHSA1/START domain